MIVTIVLFCVYVVLFLPACATVSRVELPETEKAGALITTVTCTDNDVEPAFTQFLFSGLSCLGCNLRFALDPPDRVVVRY